MENLSESIANNDKSNGNEDEGENYDAHVVSSRIYDELEKAFKCIDKSRHSCEKLNVQALGDGETPGSLTWLTLRKQYWSLARSKQHLRSFTTTYQESHPMTKKTDYPLDIIPPYPYIRLSMQSSENNKNNMIEDYPTDVDWLSYLLGDTDKIVKAVDSNPYAMNRDTTSGIQLQGFYKFSETIKDPLRKPYLPNIGPTGMKSISPPHVLSSLSSSSTSYKATTLSKPLSYIPHPSGGYTTNYTNRPVIHMNPMADQRKLIQAIEQQNYQKQLEIEKLRQERAVMIAQREQQQLKDLARFRYEQEEKRRKEEQLRRDIEEREQKSHQLLVKKYNYVPPSKFSSWLHRIRPYWNDVRRKNNPLVFDEHDGMGSDLGSEVLIPVYDTIDEEYSDLDNIGFVGVDEGVSFEYGENLMMEGFIAVAKMLDQTCDHMYMTVTGCGRYDYKSWLTSTGSPCFCYENNPLPGWRKDIVVRMAGKTRGQTEIIYVAPGTGKRLRGKNILHSYLLSEGISTACLSKFEYHGLFCVCHTKDDKSRSYLECSLGLAGCRQWLHSECVGLGILREDQIRRMEAVICPYCAAYLDGTNEHDEFSVGKKLLRKVTITQPSTTSAVNGYGIEEFSQPHKIWGSDRVEKYQFLDDTYKQLIQERKEPSSSAATSSDDHHLVQLSSLSSHLESSAMEAAGSENTDRDHISSDNLLDTSPLRSKKSSQANNIPGIFQHRLFQEHTASSTDGDNMDDGDDHMGDASDCGFFSLNIDRGPAVEEYNDDVLPCDRIRYAKDIDGPVITVRLEGACTHLPRSYHPSSHLTSSASVSYEQVQRIKDKRAEILAKSAETDFSLVLGHRYGRDLIQANMTRAIPARRAVVDKGEAILSLDDGGLRMTCLNPPSSIEIYSTRSLHQLCINHDVCGLCLQPIDVIGKKLKSSSLRRKRSYPQKKRPGRKKSILSSTIIQEKLEHLDDDMSDEEDDEHDVVEENVVEATLKASTYAGIVEQTYGMVTYPLHNHCIMGLDCLHHNEQSIITCKDRPYAYDMVDDAQCDICGRRGGVVVYFNINSSHSSLSPPSAEGWLAHAPCIYWLMKSNMLHSFADDHVAQRLSWNKLVPANQSVPAKSLFDLSFRMAPCMLCGLCEGIVYRCNAIGCTISAHALCISQASSLNWTISMTDHRVSKIMICLCPQHSFEKQA